MESSSCWTRTRGRLLKIKKKTLWYHLFSKCSASYNVLSKHVVRFLLFVGMEVSSIYVELF
jgi:hypothetical protein